MQHRNLQSAAGEGQLWVEHSRFVLERQRAQSAEAQVHALRDALRGIEAGSGPTIDQLVRAIAATMLLVFLSFTALVFTVV
jgi:hypothetical protein